MQIPSPTNRETTIGGNYALRERCVFVFSIRAEGYNQQKSLQAGTVPCTILKPGRSDP